MAISNLLNISKYSLGVYQKAMEVTSHNISNANNPEYSRQQVVFATNSVNAGVPGNYGSGVNIQDVLRIKNNLTETQIRSYNQKYGDANKRSEMLEQIESIFQEPTDLGLSNLMANFFNSFDKLAATPNSASLRSNVVDSAEKVSSQIQNVYDGLINSRADILAEANSTVQDVNHYLSQIQVLNQKISQANLSDVSPNDLLDERDGVINQLSSLVNINVSNNSQDMVTISIGGLFAVDQYFAAQFKTDIVDNKLVVKTTDDLNTLSLSGGELYAMTDIYSNEISDNIEKVNSIAQQLMTSVNTMHRTGYTNHQPPQTNIDFFTSYGSGKLVVNSQLQDDPNYVAASATGELGNNEVALKLADLGDAKLIENQSINDYYNAFVSEVGSTKQISDDATDANRLVLDQLEIQKASYSGVSIDEEMTNVIKFQRAYEACASMVKVADEMLQTLLGMVQ